MDVLEWKMRISNKQHTCFGCLEKIEEGQQYIYSKQVDSGDFSDIKLCLLCADVANEYCNLYPLDGYGEGDLGYFRKQMEAQNEEEKKTD